MKSFSMPIRDKSELRRATFRSSLVPRNSNLAHSCPFVVALALPRNPRFQSPPSHSVEEDRHPFSPRRYVARRSSLGPPCRLRSQPARQPSTPMPVHGRHASTRTVHGASTRKYTTFMRAYTKYTENFVDSLEPRPSQPSPFASVHNHSRSFTNIHTTPPGGRGVSMVRRYVATSPVALRSSFPVFSAFFRFFPHPLPPGIHRNFVANFVANFVEIRAIRGQPNSAIRNPQSAILPKYLKTHFSHSHL